MKIIEMYGSFCKSLFLGGDVCVDRKRGVGDTRRKAKPEAVNGDGEMAH